MGSKLTVVANLDRAQVSWANGFCNAVETAGAEVVNRPWYSANATVLYIGDSIDWTSIGAEQRAGYFLAAADGTDVEDMNIRNARLTTTVSQAEKSRAEHLFGTKTLAVDGFPINFMELNGVRRSAEQRTIPTVGFIGRTDKDKGPELELAIADIARKLGAEVVHISNMTNELRPELEEIGVKVYERVTRAEYLGRLANLGCVINTSPRESLYVSGIEASYFGVPVIAPDVEGSGIADWNPKERFFDGSKPEEAANIAVALAAAKAVDTPDVSRYAAEPYVQRVLERLEASL